MSSTETPFKSKAKQWLPLVLSGFSVALSVYTYIKCTDKSHSHSKYWNTNTNNKKSISFLDHTESEFARLSRIYTTVDANHYGNVHGGIILKHIAHCGWLCALRFINSNIKNKDNDYIYSAIMVKMEETNFKLPAYVGDIGIYEAKVIFTSNKTCQVKVNVYSENVMTGEKRLTDTALTWFVGIKLSKNNINDGQISKDNVILMPKYTHYANAMEYNALYSNYKRAKQNREINKINSILNKDILGLLDLKEFIDRVLMNSDYDKQRGCPIVERLSMITFDHDAFPDYKAFVDAGLAMKELDNVSALVAIKFCQKSMVTVNVSDMEFPEPLLKGTVLHCYGRICFTSKKSIVVLAMAFEESSNNNNKSNNVYIPNFNGLKLICSAFYTFVALDPKNKGKTLPLKQFKPNNDSNIEMALYNLCKHRYEMAKQQRLSKKKGQ